MICLFNWAIGGRRGEDWWRGAEKQRAEAWISREGYNIIGMFNATEGDGEGTKVGSCTDRRCRWQAG